MTGRRAEGLTGDWSTGGRDQRAGPVAAWPGPLVVSSGRTARPSHGSVAHRGRTVVRSAVARTLPGAVDGWANAPGPTGSCASGAWPARSAWPTPRAAEGGRGP
ncbi:hypothetical protein [Streptomyces sp. WMMB 322]|uniref:hypothetical protein n=1 Tax=Streptomyces sp. WMMB 322 TaxID=1286821 RepID=UPI000B05D74C|nr:hypothetical protein [Streptomyces sp. WMMB 322]